MSASKRILPTADRRRLRKALAKVIPLMGATAFSVADNRTAAYLCINLMPKALEALEAAEESKP